MDRSTRRDGQDCHGCYFMRGYQGFKVCAFEPTTRNLPACRWCGHWQPAPDSDGL